jgi:hypothetical protein
VLLSFDSFNWDLPWNWWGIGTPAFSPLILKDYDPAIIRVEAMSRHRFFLVRARLALPTK